MADGLFIYVLCIGILNGVIGSLRWRAWVEENARIRFLWLSAAALNLAWVVAAMELLALPRPIPPVGIRWYVAAMGVTWLLVAILIDPVQRWRARRNKETS